jgi:hypothetical protein
MLSKGIKSEEQEKLNQIIEEGLQMDLVPDLWKTEQRKSIDEIFQQALGLALDEVEALPNEEWLKRIKKQDLNFSNAEKIGDLLLKISFQEPEKIKSDLSRKAVMLYENAQEEHKIFSFGLIQKIKNAKAE